MIQSALSAELILDEALKHVKACVKEIRVLVSSHATKLQRSVDDIRDAASRGFPQAGLAGVPGYPGLPGHTSPQEAQEQILLLTKQIVKLNADSEMLCKFGDRFSDTVTSSKFVFLDITNSRAIQ